MSENRAPGRPPYATLPHLDGTATLIIISWFFAVVRGMASVGRRCVTGFPNPNGIEALSPGLRLAAPKRSEGGGRRYPGNKHQMCTNLKGLNYLHKVLVSNPFRVVNIF
jgi:hypothetical protein